MRVWNKWWLNYGKESKRKCLVGILRLGKFSSIKIWRQPWSFYWILQVIEFQHMFALFTSLMHKGVSLVYFWHYIRLFPYLPNILTFIGVMPTDRGKNSANKLPIWADLLVPKVQLVVVPVETGKSIRVEVDINNFWDCLGYYFWTFSFTDIFLSAIEILEVWDVTKSHTVTK